MLLSELKIGAGREIKFPRAVLSLQNEGPEPVKAMISGANIVQEGGMPQELTGTLNKNLVDLLILPRETVNWDLYELLLAEHPGLPAGFTSLATKQFLNWWFEFSTEVSFRISDEAPWIRSPLFQSKFRWSASKPDLKKVDLFLKPFPHEFGLFGRIEENTNQEV